MSFNKIFFTVVFILALLFIGLPMLFSAKSTEAVLLGLLLVLGGVYYVGNKFFKFLKEEFKDED